MEELLNQTRGVYRASEEAMQIAQELKKRTSSKSKNTLIVVESQSKIIPIMYKTAKPLEEMLEIQVSMETQRIIVGNIVIYFKTLRECKSLGEEKFKKIIFAQ